MNECPYCDAHIVGSYVCHAPDCPTWEREADEEEE